MQYPTYPAVDIRHYPDGFTMSSAVRIKREDKWYLIPLYQDTIYPPGLPNLALTDIVLNAAKRFAADAWKIEHLYIIAVNGWIGDTGIEELDELDENQEEESKRLLDFFPKNRLPLK